MSVFPDTPVSMLARIAKNVTGESESVWAQFFGMYQAPIVKFAEYVAEQRRGCGAGDIHEAGEDS